MTCRWNGIPPAPLRRPWPVCPRSRRVVARDRDAPRPFESLCPSPGAAFSSAGSGLFFWQWLFCFSFPCHTPRLPVSDFCVRIDDCEVLGFAILLHLGKVPQLSKRFNGRKRLTSHTRGGSIILLSVDQHPFSVVYSSRTLQRTLLVTFYTQYLAKLPQNGNSSPAGGPQVSVNTDTPTAKRAQSDLPFHPDADREARGGV